MLDLGWGLHRLRPVCHMQSTIMPAALYKRCVTELQGRTAESLHLYVKTIMYCRKLQEGVITHHIFSCQLDIRVLTHGPLRSILHTYCSTLALGQLQAPAVIYGGMLCHCAGAWQQLEAWRESSPKSCPVLPCTGDVLPGQSLSKDGMLLQRF